LQLKVKGFYRYNSNYRQIADVTIEVCQMLAGDYEHHIYGGFFKHFNEVVPGLIHNCPYQSNDLQVKNLTIGRNHKVVWPTGDYRVQVSLHTKDDAEFGTFTISSSIRNAGDNIEF